MSPWMVGFLLLGGPLLLVGVHDLVRRPTSRRLALRNISRRRGEALLVVLGSLLGTAIITSAFVVGDSIDHSIRDIARTNLGPIDEMVGIRPDSGVESELASVRAVVDDAELTAVDGLLDVVTSGGVAAAGEGDARRGEPLTNVGEADFDDARRFGDDVAATGLADAGATPGPGETVINRTLADELRVDEGDDITLYLYGNPLSLQITRVLPEVGLAGAVHMYVEPGTIEAAADQAAVPGEPPAGRVLVSNDGGVFEGEVHTEAVIDTLRAELEAAGMVDFELDPAKADLLDAAADQGTGIGSLFTFIGSFSVVAGVLLVVNLFIMLGEERKTELGMMRAVGLRRSHLLRTFGLEGAIYSVVSAGVGALLGVGVGWILIEATTYIFSGDSGLVFGLAVEPSALIGGAVYGCLLGVITVWLTSVRISRLNVISAIRDLPEPRRPGRRLGRLVLGLLGVAAGGLLTVVGLSAEDSALTLLGPGVAMFASLAVTLRFLPARTTLIVTSLGVIIWNVLAFTVAADAMKDSSEQTFLIQGVLMVGAAVIILVQVDHLWVALARRLADRRGGLASRLALAYPLARRVRTGLLLAMFAMVLFVMTFLSVFDGIMRSQAADFAREQRAGFDLYVDSNPANPITTSLLAEQPEVAAVAALTHGWADMQAPWDDEPEGWAITGFDESLLAFGGPTLAARADAYSTDAAVYDAVLADPSLAIVDDFFREEDGGPSSVSMEVGDEFVVVSPTGDEYTMTVAGILSQDWIFNGTLMSREVVDEIMGPLAVENRHYVSLVPEAEATAVATQFDGRLLENGTAASSFRDEIDKEMAENSGFFNLMRGYLGIGLVIGIAGLGVVMVRAVRERRREIGMLRAMGVRAPTVRRAFMIEAGFLALQGIVIGIGLGALSAYQVLVNSDTFGEQTLSFSVPWTALAVISLVPLVVSLLAAARPANRAAAIRPAMALRIAD